MIMNFFTTLLLLTIATLSAADVDPKIWTICNGDNLCTCGNAIDSAVMCTDGSILIQPCYCMYYDQVEKRALVGSCMQTCYYVHSGNAGNYHLSNRAIFSAECDGF